MTRTKAAKARSARAKALRQPRKNCPHPAKAAYKTEAAIPVALRRSKASGRPMRIYKCACGSLHLTSKPERKEVGSGVVQRG